MSDESSQAQTLEQLSREDLLRITVRDRYVKSQMDQHLAVLFRENVELMALVQEMRGDNALLREQTEVLKAALQSEQEKNALGVEVVKE